MLNGDIADDDDGMGFDGIIVDDGKRCGTDFMSKTKLFKFKSTTLQGPSCRTYTYSHLRETDSVASPLSSLSAR